MRQAFLILTKNVNEQLFNLIRALDSSNHTFFIHVDKKIKQFSEKKVKGIAKKANIIFVPRVSVTWGGFSIVKAELNLIKTANSYGEFGHFHLLSGEDFPVKNNEQIDCFFSNHSQSNFLEVSSRIKKQNVDRYYLRYQQYHLLQDTLIGKKNNAFKYIDFLSCYLQRFIGMERIEKRKIKSGAQWFSLNQEFIEYILDHEKWINDQFKYTYCPDEAFIQTLIRNTKFEKTLFDNGNSNLRFVDFYWKSKHDLTPRYLTNKDFKLITDPHYVFARKFDVKYSDLFLEKLKSSEF